MQRGAIPSPSPVDVAYVRAVDAAEPHRARGLLPGFVNSADLGGMALPHGKRVPSRRIIRADTPGDLSDDELAAANAFGFVAVLDLRSHEELRTSPHPLAHHSGYQSLPLIDPAAEAREDFSRYRTLGAIYSSSLQRNATHIAAIFNALASAPQWPGAVMVSCHAGRDRTGMVVALLLDLAGVGHEAIAADYALYSRVATPAALSTQTERPRQGTSDITQMLEHVTATYGSTSHYLRSLGLDDRAIDGLRRRLEP